MEVQSERYKSNIYLNMRSECMTVDVNYLPRNENIQKLLISILTLLYYYFTMDLKTFVYT